VLCDLKIRKTKALSEKLRNKPETFQFVDILTTNRKWKLELPHIVLICKYIYLYTMLCLQN